MVSSALTMLMAHYALLLTLPGTCVPLPDSQNPPWNFLKGLLDLRRRAFRAGERRFRPRFLPESMLAGAPPIPASAVRQWHKNVTPAVQNET